MNHMFGNYIDLFLIFYTLIFALAAMRKSAEELIAHLVGLFLALPMAFLTYHLSAGFFQSEFGLKGAYANPLGFFLNLFLLRLAVNLALERLFARHAGWFRIKRPSVRQLFSFLLGAFDSLLVLLIISYSLISLSLPGFVKTQVGESRLGGWLLSDPFRLEDDFSGVFGQLLPAATQDFGFLRVQTGPNEKQDLGFKVLETKVDSAEEEKMLAMVNQERTSRGLKPLVMDEEARRAARDYGQYLFKNGIFSHTDLEGRSPSDRLKNYDIQFTMAGENLAFAPSLQEAHTGLMNSQGHRENILRPFFGRVGIGVIDGGRDYGMIFVQEFLD